MSNQSTIITVEDGKSGILVKNEKYLKDAIVTLLKDDKLNEDMGLYGEKFVREKFDIYNVCSEWKKLLEDVYNDVPQKEELINNNLLRKRGVINDFKYFIC